MLNTTFVSFGEFFIDYTYNDKKTDMKEQHYHDTTEVYLQISGQRTVFLDDISYVLKPGDMYLLKPFQIHYTESQEADFYERYVMNFPFEKLSCLLPEADMKLLASKLDNCVINLDKEQTAMVLDCFKKAHYYHGKSGVFSERLLYSAIFQMLVLVEDLKEANGAAADNGIPPEIINAIHYINKHYAKEISLEGLSDMVYLSKFHFCRLFRTYTGATFLEYLYNVRLSKAHKLLIETDLPLSEIAEKTGFSSTAHLTRVFRLTYNAAPSEFRRLIKRKSPS